MAGKVLYFTRIAQLLFGIGFLILIADASVHRGWWDNINGAVAVGGKSQEITLLETVANNTFIIVIATVFTFALTLHTIITHHLNKNPFSGGSSIRTILRLVIEVLAFFLWIAAAGLMLRNKTGCYVRTIKGIEYCAHDDVNKDKLHSDRPLARWDIGIAFAFVEM